MNDNKIQFKKFFTNIKTFLVDHFTGSIKTWGTDATHVAFSYIIYTIGVLNIGKWIFGNDK